MSKPLIIGDEIYNYPTTGEINYGEEATGWAEDATGVLAEVSGPGDIPTTKQNLVGTLNVSTNRYEGSIVNLKFDTAYIQSIEVTGHITRTYQDATPDQVEYFSIQGAYNGTVINFSVDYSGDDTELEFTESGGLFSFSYLNIADTDTVVIKYAAKAKFDEDFFA